MLDATAAAPPQPAAACGAWEADVRVAVERPQESLDHAGVELDAGTGLELRARAGLAERGPVDAVGGHRLEGVRHGEDARLERDLRLA